MGPKTRTGRDDGLGTTTGKDHGSDTVRAVIFDMDGVLVDSEPLWRRAEVAVLRPLGVPITEELCALTMGLRADEVVRYWSSRHPWTSRAHTDVVAEMIDTVESMLGDVEPLPGAVRAVIEVRALGVPVALASSSSRRLIAAVLRGLDLESVFDVVHSAESEPFGKPHPANERWAAVLCRGCGSWLCRRG